MLFSPTYSLSCKRTPGEMGSNKVFFPTCIVCLKLSGSTQILELPEIFQASGYFQTAQFFSAWMKKLSSTFIRCLKWSGETKIPKLPKCFELKDFSRVTIFLGDNNFFKNLYNIVGQLTNSKNAQMFLKHPGKIFRASAILEFPKF